MTDKILMTYKNFSIEKFSSLGEQEFYKLMKHNIEPLLISNCPKQLGRVLKGMWAKDNLREEGILSHEKR